MSDERPTGPSAEDLVALDRYAAALADGIEASLASWVERCVVGTIESRGGLVTGVVRARAREAGAAATADVAPRVRALLAIDIDEQRTGPLAIVREAVIHPTAVLVEAGVAPADRDAQAIALFPDDLYDLVPASFADLDPALAEAGIAWGAAKAHVHLMRRRSGPDRS